MAKTNSTTHAKCLKCDELTGHITGICLKCRKQIGMAKQFRLVKGTR